MWVCRLPVHTGFTEILGEFVTSHWADRVVGPYGEASMHTYPVGADDSVRPQTAPVFTGIYGESVASQRADVGIGPYMTPANSCCPAKSHGSSEKFLLLAAIGRGCVRGFIHSAEKSCFFVSACFFRRNPL